MNHRNRIIHGDCIEEMAALEEGSVQLIVADPPYYKVLTDEDWDNCWESEEAYLDWTQQWMKQAMRLLAPGGLLYCFGQLGKREHVMLHLMSQAAHQFDFHDLIIWDRRVGYNERRDSFTPAYEMIYVARKEGEVCFDKDAVREPYDEATIALYARDKRYKDKKARMAHLRRGKYATNVWRIASLKGSSKEKVGHPSQKPLKLLERIIASSSRAGDVVLDPFLGSGSTAVAAQQQQRQWIGIEKSAEYVEMAKERLEEDKAKLF